MVSGTSWNDAALVALDLEGSGAQNREHEDILEIAIVPVIGGRPAVGDAYTTMINPGRPIPRRRWISPGLSTDVLARTPGLDAVAPELTAACTTSTWADTSSKRIIFASAAGAWLCGPSVGRASRLHRPVAGELARNCHRSRPR